jgi:uncharacterized protein (DUF302 family)
VYDFKNIYPVKMIVACDMQALEQMMDGKRAYGKGRER